MATHKEYADRIVECVGLNESVLEIDDATLDRLRAEANQRTDLLLLLKVYDQQKTVLDKLR